MLLPTSKPVYRSGTRFQSGQLCLLGMLGTGLSFGLYGSVLIYKFLFFSAGLLCLCTSISGFCGLFKSSVPSLIWSLMLSISCCYGLLILGGTLAFLLPHIPAEIAFLHEIQYVNVLQRNSLEIHQTIEATRQYFIIQSAVSGILAVCAGLVARSQYRNLGIKRGAVAILQSFGISILPLALGLMIAGQYLVTTHFLSSAPYAGLWMFFTGLSTLILCLQAFVGSAFEYRRLLRYFTVFVSVLSCGLLITAVLIWALGDHVREWIRLHGHDIRMLLLPTSRAKYDPAHFERYLEVYSNLVAYLCFVTSGYLDVQVMIATALGFSIHRGKLRVERDQNFLNQRRLQNRVSADENSAQEGIVDDPVDDETQKMAIVRQSLSPRLAFRHQWMTHFETSKAKHRRLLRIGCAFCVVLCFLVVLLMAGSLMVVSQCPSLSTLDDRQRLEYPNTSFVQFNILSKYRVGSLDLHAAPSTDPQGHITIEGYSTIEDPEHAHVIQSDANVLELEMTPPSTSSSIFWLDVSCQETRTTLAFPSLNDDDDHGSPIQSLDIHTITGMNINLFDTPRESALHVDSVNLSTESGNIDLTYGILSCPGLTLESFHGAIHVSHVSLECLTYDGLSSRAQVQNMYGPMTMTNMTLLNAWLELKSFVGPISLDTIESLVTPTNRGWTGAAIESHSGSITMSHVAGFSWLDLETFDGLIEGTDIRTKSTSGQVARVSCRSHHGHIRLRSIESKGYIHAETHTGNVEIHIKSYSFRGVFNLRSEIGTIDIRAGSFAFDQVQHRRVKTGQHVSGEINCDNNNVTTTDSRNTLHCSYGGDLYVETYSGNIRIIIGCDDEACS